MPEPTERKPSKLTLLKRAAARKMAAQYAVAKASLARANARLLSDADRRCADARDARHDAALGEAQAELDAATKALADLEADDAATPAPAFLNPLGVRRIEGQPE